MIDGSGYKNSQCYAFQLLILSSSLLKLPLRLQCSIVLLWQGTGGTMGVAGKPWLRPKVLATMKSCGVVAVKRLREPTSKATHVYSPTFFCHLLVRSQNLYLPGAVTAAFAAYLTWSAVMSQPKSEFLDTFLIYSPGWFGHLRKNSYFYTICCTYLLLSSLNRISFSRHSVRNISLRA